MQAADQASRIKAYIDIDGVLLASGESWEELIPEFSEVVIFLKGNFDCYWLTTHVRHGVGSDGAARCLASHLKNAGIDKAILDGIKPTEWERLKTEAIDFTGPFIWLDDDPLPSEREVLRKNGCEESLVAIDWSRRSTGLTVDRLRRVLRSLAEQRGRS